MNGEGELTHRAPHHPPFDIEMSGERIAKRVLLVYDLDEPFGSQRSREPLAIDHGETRFQRGLGCTSGSSPVPGHRRAFGDHEVEAGPDPVSAVLHLGEDPDLRAGVQGHGADDVARHGPLGRVLERETPWPQSALKIRPRPSKICLL